MLSIVSMLGAQEAVLVSGSSHFQKGRLQKAIIGSITAVKELPRNVCNATAMLEDEQGQIRAIPCEAESFATPDGREEDIIWRLHLPSYPVLRKLEIKQGERLLARFEASSTTASPMVEFIETPQGNTHASLAWMLKRNKAFEKTSYWIRWSHDGGKTWQPGAQLVAGDELASTLTFPESAPGVNGTILEVWVPEGIRLFVLRHTLGAKH